MYNNRYIYVKIFHINNEGVRAIGRKKEKLRKREGGGREVKVSFGEKSRERRWRSRRREKRREIAERREGEKKRMLKREKRRRAACKGKGEVDEGKVGKR